MTRPAFVPVREILYEFNLTCDHTAKVEVDEQNMPRDGVYTCPVCGAEEAVPR